MHRLTLVFPCIGRFEGNDYVRSWQMQPLSMAVLAALTPRKQWEITFYDDRLEDIDYEAGTDLVAMSIETYTARRGYQIARRFRDRGIPVVLGGFHATLCPAEAMEHADAVCMGPAEGVWPGILQDVLDGTLQRCYHGQLNGNLAGVAPDRSIFRGKNYLPLALVETGRGCPYHCRFCSVTAFYRATHHRRPVGEVVREIEGLGPKRVFFVDDNLTGSIAGARELFEAIKPLGITWISQTSIDALRDEKLLELMAESGCAGLLVGFESMNPSTLSRMGKRMNRVDEYTDVLAKMRRAGIVVYGSFVFGYPDDSSELMEKAIRFARDQKMFVAAFAHLVPFPGTALYEELKEANRLPDPRWWLSGDFRFGQAPYRPWSVTAKQLEMQCHEARRRFYSISSILGRGLDLRANCSSGARMAAYFTFNGLLRREVGEKRGLPLGLRRAGEATA